MRQAFEQQLARGEELPPVPGVRAFLDENVTQEEGDRLYERFLWELRREREPRQALEAARFARALQPAPATSIPLGLQALQQRIAREPLTLASGQHLTAEHGFGVVNFADRAVTLSGTDLRLAADVLPAGLQLAVAVDDQAPSARRTERTLVWNIGTHSDSTAEAWRALEQCLGGSPLPSWLHRWADSRPLASFEELADEHRVRADRTRETIIETLLAHSYGPAGSELSSLEEEEAEWALAQMDHYFRHYTQQPRLALTCRGLKDFTPLADWQQYGPAGLRALINTVTGDNPLVGAALGAAGRLRLGNLAFTGDPDHNGDDLLSAVLPPQECSVVLRPETLERTLFLSGVPHPTANLPVPSLEQGLYHTLAVGANVTEMLRTRAYLALTPVTEESLRDYFQGRGSHVRLEESTANPAFQALITAVMMRRKQGEDSPVIKGALRVAAAHAIYVGLNRDPHADPISGIHLGGLTLDDVEQVVVTLRSQEEWQAYHHSGRVPSWLRGAFRFYAERDIRLRARAPVGHGSMAVAE